MKILALASICCVLTACVDNGTTLGTLCLQKDPNLMTDREIEMCKTYLQRPILYQN